MLRRSLHELSIGALFGGPEMVDVLSAHLRSLRRGTDALNGLVALQTRCRGAIGDDLDRRWPRSFRLNELEIIANHLCSSSFLVDPDLPALQAGFEELMELDGELISFRPSHVQAYARLSAEIEPAMLVGWHLAGRSRGWNPLEPRELQRMVSIQSPYFAPRALSQWPVAENHAHLGGIFGDDLVLAQLILGLHDHELTSALTRVDVPEDRGTLSRIRLTRRLLGAFVTIWVSTRIEVPLAADQLDSMLSAACDEDPLISLQSHSIDWRTLAEGLDAGSNVDGRWVLLQLASAIDRGDLQDAWLWLFLALWRTYRDPNSSVNLRVAVLVTVGELMILRRRLVMDGQGLRRFTNLYYSPRMRSVVKDNDRWADALCRDVARRVFVDREDLAELKIAPDAFGPSIAAQLARGVDGLADDPSFGLLVPIRDQARAERQRLRHGTLDRWHFCVHFTRRGSGAVLDRRISLWAEAKELAAAMARRSGWNIDAFLGGQDEAGHQLEPSRFVRGFDVAGDETKWPIEIFAPILRWLRNVDTPPNEARTPIARPHLSIHAGEDYSHPLSGMRHVDETVRFCEMTRGDRLGHALALGIRPMDWLERHGDVLIPVEEHLDNLIWAWQAASRLAARLPLATRVLSRFERRIFRFLPHVAWRQPPRSSLLVDIVSGSVSSAALTLDDLHAAWLLRRNCAYLLLREDSAMPLVDDRMRAGVPDSDRLFRAMRRHGADPVADLYLARARGERERRGDSGPSVLLRASGDFERQRQERLEELGPNAMNLIHDHDEPEDVEFMEAIQDFMLDTYERSGLILEANPSSNVYIARMTSHHEHPIFRWHPPDPLELVSGARCNRFGLRRGAIPVTINTDDQGIMPTTLRSELHLMREAAVDRGASGGIADAWIEEIRRLGVEQFRRNHIPVFD